jgi:predicted RNA-binding Zn ribbon-like protein
MPQSLSPAIANDKIRLDGGRLCLDFVNTIHDRFAAVLVDYLATPRQYLEWCLRAGALTRHELERAAAPAGAAGEARIFREHLYAVLGARIDGAAVPANSLRECDRWLHQAWADLSLDTVSAAGVSWSATAFDALLPLKRIALSALEVLRTAEPRRLKRCAASGSCGWLFYDDSKGGQRRWCAMETCGTIEKMRRYRRNESAGTVRSE